jgi:hypothetical protein
VEDRVTALGVAAWTDLDNDGVATATLNSSGGTTVTGESDVPGLVADLATKAPLASPTFTGAPAFPTGANGATQSAADSTTKLATTAFTTTADNLKANLASPALTGSPVFPTGTTGVTQTAANGTTRLATTAYVDTADALLAVPASPTFTGTVTTPNGVGATDLAAFGQVPTAGGLAGYSKVVARTADSTPITSSATFANDDTLKWTVGANDRWVFQAYLTFTAADSSGAATTADVKTDFSVPASGTMQHGMLGITGGTFSGYGSTLIGQSPGRVRTEAEASNASAIGAAAVSFGMALCGFYQGGGTGGTVNLQWAQGTSNAATLLIAKNSILILWRVA